MSLLHLISRWYVVEKFTVLLEVQKLLFSLVEVALGVLVFGFFLLFGDLMQVLLEGVGFGTLEVESGCAAEASCS